VCVDVRDLVSLEKVMEEWGGRKRVSHC